MGRQKDKQRERKYTVVHNTQHSHQHLRLTIQLSIKTNTEKTRGRTGLQDAQLARENMRNSRDVVELVSAIIDVLQVGVHVGPAVKPKKRKPANKKKKA